MTALTKIGKCLAFTLVVSGALAGAVWGIGLAREPDGPPAQKKSALPMEQPAEEPQKQRLAQSEIKRDQFNDPLPREVRQDAAGDPLPPGATGRLGSARWRHEGEARAMSFSPDGHTLAVLSGQDGAISFFAAETGKLTHRLRPPTEDYAAPINLAYAPDGSAIAGQDGWCNIHVWDAKTKKPIRTLKMPARIPPGGSFMKICFSADGKLLAANNGEATIVLWNIASGKQVLSITDHNHGNPALCFARDGATLLVAAGKPLVLYDTRTGKLVRGIDAELECRCLAVSADGKTVAMGGSDRIILSDFDSGKEISRLDAKMGALLDVAFTPDGKTLLSAGEDSKVRVWDVAARKERFVLDGRGWMGRSMALSKDGKTVALGTVYNVVRLWDVATGKERFDLPDGHDAPVHAVTFSPDGRLLATGGENQQIRLWDPATGRLVRRVGGKSANTLSFSPDGRRLVSAWEGNPKVQVCDVERGVAVKTISHQGQGDVRVPNAAFAVDGRSILSVSWQRSDDASAVLTTWDGETGKPTSAVELSGLKWPSALAVSPDKRWAVVGGSGQPPVRQVDLKRQRERRIQLDEHAKAQSLAFSPDGRVLAVGAIDRSIRLVEAETGVEIMRLSGHDWTVVAAVAWSPDGRVLATADGGPHYRYWEDKRGPQTIRFWDLATGRELARLQGHDSNVNALAFAPGGRQLVSGLNNGTVLVWETPAAARPTRLAARKLARPELAGLWKDLAGLEVRRAFDAVWALAGSEQGASFLAESIRLAAKVDAGKVRQCLADLDSDTFAEREAASRQLAALGEDIEAELRAALPVQPSEEARRRVQMLLDTLLNAPPPDRLRELRGIWALELNGSPAARDALVPRPD